MVEHSSDFETSSEEFENDDVSEELKPQGKRSSIHATNDKFKESPTKGKSDIRVASQSDPKKAGLTLEDIRAGLGISNLRGSALNKATDQNEEPLIDNSGDLTTQKLLDLCLELLELTHLLENGRSETAKEWTEKCQVVRQFERLYDSVRDREVLFRGKVIEQRRKFQQREGKYLNLKKRARQHLREWQSERDRYAVESRVTTERAEALELQLELLNSDIAEKKEELQILREKAKNMPSEKETTDLNLRLRSLQNENSQLLTDRATLKLTLDELAANLQKRLPSSATPESFAAVLNTVCGDDPNRFRSPRLDDDVTTRGRAGVDMQLEKKAEKLEAAIRQQTEDFRAEMKELKTQVELFRDYKKTLEGMLSNGNEENTFT